MTDFTDQILADVDTGPDPMLAPVAATTKVGMGSDWMDQDAADTGVLITSALRNADFGSSSFGQVYLETYGKSLAQIKSMPREAIERYYASEQHRTTMEANAQLERVAREYYAMNRPQLAASVLQQRGRQQGYLDSLTPEQALAEQQARAIDPRLAYGNPFAAQRYMEGTVQRRLVDVSGWDKTWSLAKSILFPLRDNYKRGVEMRPDLQRAYGEVFNVRPNTITGMAEHFDKLSPTEKMRGFERLEKVVWESSRGDWSTYLDVIDPFLDVKNTKWLQGYTALDFASIVPFVKAPNALARLSKSRILYKMAAEQGNFEKAGESLLVKLDPNLAKISGDSGQGHRLVARITADPVLSRVDDAAVVIPGLTAAVGKAAAKKDMLLAADLNMFDERIVAIVQNALPDVKKGTLLGVEKEAWKEKVTETFLDAGRIKWLSDTKFEVEMDVINPVFADYTRATGTVAETQRKIDNLSNSLVDTVALMEDAEKIGDMAGAKALRQEMEVYRKALTKMEATKAEEAAAVEKLKTAGAHKAPEEIVQTRTIEANIDDVGSVELISKDDRTGVSGRWLASRQHNLDRIVKDAVSDFTIRTYRSSKVDQGIKRLMKEIYQDLGIWRKSSKSEKVDKWLLAGDERKVQFDPEIMRNGFGDLPKLSEAEIGAYYKMRRISDAMFYMNNRVRRDALEFAGYKEITLVQDGERLPKAFVDPSKIVFDIRATRISEHRKSDKWGTATEVFDVETQKWISTSSPEFRKGLSSKEIGLLETRSQFRAQDKSGKWVAVKTAGRDPQLSGLVRDISPMVLEKRVGYVPKVYENLNYIVTKSGYRNVNGVRTLYKEPVVGFETQTEAQRWIEKNLPKGSDVEFTAESTAAMRRTGGDEIEALDEGLFLGSFGQYREDKAIKFGPQFSEAQRMNAWESFDMYSEYLARHSDVQGYKQSMIRRYENTIKDIETKYKGQFKILTGDSWTSDIEPALKDYPWYSDLVEYQDTMKGWFAVPNSTEQVFDSFTAGVGRAIEKAIIGDGSGTYNKGVKWAAGKAHALSEKDPLSELKRLTFNFMFGFNPVQLLVQSAGMFIPFSLHPVKGLKIMPDFTVLRATWGAENMRVTRYAAEAVLGKKLNAGEWKRYETIMDAYKRSGIPDSVMQNADYGSNIMRRNRYMTAKTWRDLWSNGLFFYRMGELNTRTYAWMMAYDDLVGMGRRGAKLSDAEIDAVTKESLRLAINMSPANAAKWQHGPLSIPTQFMQITAKYYENIVKGLTKRQNANWTQAEAARSIGMHIGLFGAAGSGLMPDKARDDFNRNVMNWMTSKGIGGLGLDPLQNAAELSAMHKIMFGIINGGLVETSLNAAISGGDDMSLISFSQRFSVTSGLAQTKETFASPWGNWAAHGQDPGILKTLGGPTASMFTRQFKAGMDIAKFFGNVKDPSNISIEQWGAAAGSVGSLLSASGNNAYQAAIWASMNDIVSPKTGFRLGLVPEGDEINPAVVFAKAVGLTPNALIQYNDIKRQLGKISKEETAASQEIARRLHRATKDREWVDDLNFEQVQAEIATLLLPWVDMPAKQSQILEDAWTKFGDPGMPYEKMMEELWKQRMEAQQPDAPGVNDTFLYPTLEKRN